jgi:hypothetical protein
MLREAIHLAMQGRMDCFVALLLETTKNQTAAGVATGGRSPVK